MENLSLIDKVAKLAEKGIGGEKVAAQKKLNILCMKYGVEIKNIEGMESSVRSFKYSNSESKLILSHCIWDIIGDAEIQCDSTLRNLFVVLNDLQYVQVSERYKFYYKTYKQTLTSVASAFIRTYKIGQKPIEITHNKRSFTEQPFEKIKH